MHGNGGREAHRHGANRHAGRFGIGAFAAEIGFQRRLHLIVPRLRVLAHRPAAAFVAAERKLYLGFGGQGAVAAQQHEVVGVFGGFFVVITAFENGVAIRSGHQLCGHPFTHALNRAESVGLHAGGIDIAVEARHENLIFCNLPA